MGPRVTLFVGALLLIARSTTAAPGDKLPSDCWAVFHVDIAALRKTKAYDRIAVPFATDLVEGSGIEDLKNNLGLKAKEMDSLTIGVFGLEADEGPPIDAVIRGNFNAERLVKAATASGRYEIEKQGAVTTFRHTSEYATIHAALVGDNLLLLATSPKRMKKLLAAAQAEPTKRPTLELLSRAPSAPFRIACVPNRAVTAALKEIPEAAWLLGLQSALITGVVNDETFEETLTAQASSEKEAKQVLAALQSMLSALPMGEFFKRAKLRRSGATVTVRASTTLAEIARENGFDRRKAPTVLESEGAPELKGNGQLYRILIKGRHAQINGLYGSQDERFVIVDSARHGYLVLDSDFSIAGLSRELPGDDLAFSPDGKTAFWIKFGTGDVDWDAAKREDMGYYAFPYSIPDLKKLPASPKLSKGIISSTWAICLLSETNSYAIVSWSGVQVLRIEPLRWGAHGRPKIEHPIAAAVDRKTGLLVMTGDKDRAEIFDPKTMSSVWTVKLPHKVSYSVVAAGGKAWIGTEAGVVVPIDIATRKVGEPLRLMEKGDTRLALSASDKTLAVVATTWVDSRHHPTLLKIYRIEQGKLAETSSARFVARLTPTKPVLLETKKILLLSGSAPLAWRYGDDG